MDKDNKVEPINCMLLISKAESAAYEHESDTNQLAAATAHLIAEVAKKLNELIAAHNALEDRIHSLEINRRGR